MSIARHRPHDGSAGWLPPWRELRGRLQRRAALAMGLTLAATPLAACGSDLIYGGDDGGGGETSLTWYINPDPTTEANLGQSGIAQRCSEDSDEYDVEVELLPQSATEQRIQLARRLAAEDNTIDLMSLDPVFVAEFADAGFLAPLSGEEQAAFSEGVLDGAVAGATWPPSTEEADGPLVAAPFWANTQVLWFRKQMAEDAGFDTSQPGQLLNAQGEPVTWAEIIDAASEQGGTVGVQANKYEGYVVWINALIEGAGGDIVSDTQAGAQASVDIGSEAGTEAAEIVRKLADSPAAEADLSVSNEGTVLGPFADPGGFMVNWTFAYANYNTPEFKDVFDDMGWAPYPRTVAGRPSAPPIGGIDLGIGAYSDDPALAKEAAACITSLDNQVQYAIDTGNMPASEAAYESPELIEAFPGEGLLELYRESIDNAGPRPATPYWSSIVLGVLNDWHPADSVNPQTTPEDSASFIESVLDGKSLV
ncbi:MAG: extracellular solute-binding protein [Nocardioidaceae bacterium]